jgi:2-polyprenyl-6-hydroxyphenyl methylase/3-demethylubiquinone-9 3-methyltransferase
MNRSEGNRRYAYQNSQFRHTHAYLLPSLGSFLDRERPARLFELGCGNGALAGWIRNKGIEVIGIDYSVAGIAQAKKHFPDVLFEEASVYDDLASRFGQFPVVVSLEVVEHLFDPRRFAAVAFELLEPGGVIFISTPYHGYLKNIALAVSGKMDGHFTALWDGGHIKFWSISTLGILLAEAGFVDINFLRVGRAPWSAKSMIAIARRPVV